MSLFLHLARFLACCPLTSADVLDVHVHFIATGIIILVALGVARSQDGKPDFVAGLFSALAFWLGALTSILSGFIGMRIAVFTNGRVTLAAKNEGLGKAFNVAFQGGLVMGFGA